MNRYSQITPSQFSPLSLQEIMITPTMQRQKHDQLIAQQEMLRQGLAKVDPLDVHMNEALNVKSGIENKLASQAELLGREGVNPNTQGEFLALNREYQNLIAPTGRLGQINAAKQVYAKNFNDYLEDAQKNKGWSRERALANWNQFSKQYTGFEGDKISNIGQLGAPKKVEVMDVLKDVKGLLGEQVVGEMRASGYSFQPSPDGGMVMVDRSGRRIETSNRPNLQHAQNLINQKLVGKEWQDSIRFEGENTPNIYNQLTSGINSMLSTGVVDNRGENAQYIAPSKPTKGGNGNDDIGGFEKIPYGIENTSASTDIADKINSIGGKSVGKALSYSYDVLTGNKPQAQSKSEFDKARSQVFIKPEDVLQGGELSIYNNAKKQVSNSVPGFNKLSVKEQNKLIANKASKDILTFSPIVIKPTVKSVGALIPGVQKGADIKSIGNSMLDDAIGGARVLYDVETGEPISKEDVKETVRGMSLYGVTAPHNLRNQKMIGATTNQKVSPIIATITDSEGKKRQVYVSRTGTELKSPEFAKIKSANDVFNGVVNNMNTQVRITDKNSNMYGSKVKYDSSINDGYPIIITLPNGTAERISLDEFQNDAL